MTQEIRAGYKTTEIGVIPSTWELKKLNEVTDVRDGTHESPKQSNKGIPFITSKNLKDGKLDLTEVTYISEEDHINFSKRSKVDNGDILFAMIGTIGNPIIVDTDFEFSIKNVALIKFNKTEILNKFVKYILDSSLVSEQFKRKQAGGVQKFISLGLIRDIIVPTPPIHEQQRIAEILSSTDGHIEKLDKTIEDYQLLKKGLMKKLLTEGIGHTEFKETEIGRIPAEWEVLTLDNLSEFIRDGSHGSHKEVEGGIPLLSAKDIVNGKVLIPDDSRKISIEDYDKLHKNYQICIGDVLLTIVGTIGKTAIVENVNQKFTFQRSVAIIRLLEKIDNFYLKQYLDSDYYQKQLRISTNASAQGGVYLKTLGKTLVILPSIEEQDQIAKVLTSLDKQIEMYNEEREDFIQVKKKLLDNLLTGNLRCI